MSASSEYPQSIASPLAGRRNLWVAVAIGTVAVAVVVLFAMRLTQALGGEECCQPRYRFRRCP